VSQPEAATERVEVALSASPGGVVESLQSAINDMMQAGAQEKATLIQTTAYSRAVAIEATQRADALQSALDEARATIEQQSTTIAGLMGRDKPPAEPTA
jgi:ATP-dependent protease ClpP protease subunit